MAIGTTKTDGGHEFGKEAYLIIGDPASPSTWKVRVEDTPGHTSVAQLGRAAAALTKGFRGRKVQASEEQIGAAKKKLRGLYDHMGAMPPASLKATESDSGTLAAAEIAGQLSYDDKRCLIQDALTGDRDLCCCDWPYVVELTDTDVVVRAGDDYFRYPYQIETGGDEVTFGAPVRVRLSWRDLTPEEAAEEEAEGEPAPVPAAQAVDHEPGTLAFVTDLRGLTFSDTDPVRIEVCRDGAWKHQKFGEVKVTPALRQTLLANFQANVREVGELPLDYDHEAGPAPGWIVGLQNQGQSLFADVKLTPSGAKKVRDGEYRFFSPEWHPDWENPRTATRHGATLFGGALTNKPFFRGMAAIQCSEAAASGRGGGPDTGQRENSMPDNKAPETGSGTQDPQKLSETMTAQLAEMEKTLKANEERLQAVEIENAALKAREERASVAQLFSEATFGERKLKLAPASQGALVDALMALPAEKRQAVADAVKSCAFVELGELGFRPAAEQDETTLTAEEEKRGREYCQTNGVKFDDWKSTFLDVKARRQARK